MPTISIIIPTYNRAKFLPRALDSVLSQTYQDYEIIVIDDGSTDGTKELMERYKGKVNYIVQGNRGISEARNRGIKEAKGKYIAFLDSDDYWVPEKLAKQAAVLDANPRVGIVYGRMPIIDDKGTVIGLKPSGICGKNFKELIEVWGDLPTSTVMTRKACFDRAGVFDSTLLSMEDIELWLRISRFYDLYEIEGEYLAYYSRHDDQTTKSKIKVYDGLVKVYKKLLRNYRSEIPVPLMRRRILENQYLLARAFYNEKFYARAVMTLTATLAVSPAVGRLFIQAQDSGLKKIVKIVKPYGFLMVCCLRVIWKPFEGSAKGSA